MEEKKVTFLTWVEGLFEPVKNFVVKHHQNPFLWIGVVVVGLAVFGFTYNTLTKKDGIR